MVRPATIERVTTLRPRATSLAETSPFRRATATTTPDPEQFGPYIVHEKLGEGGNAYVHRAELVSDSGLRKEVALKRLKTETSEDPDLVTAFVAEAQLAAKLQHPNIAQAYDLGKIGNTYYIAMELVPGPTLSQVMTTTRSGAGAVPLPIAIEILIEIADALDHAHNLCDDGGRPLDLIHRDVSPMNIVISRTGAAKLIDFGIAKVRSGRATTEAGFVKGKHAYIAPEYTFGQLDHRADLFGFGIVAHELLTGQRLFAAETELETLRNVRLMTVPPPSRFRSSISPELDNIVLTALERDPEKRWQSAAAIRTALVEEARRIGVAISGPQIRDWVEWAFEQSPRRDSSVDRLLEGLDPSLSLQIEIDWGPELTPDKPSQIIELVAPKPVEAPKPARKRRRPRVVHGGPKWRAPTRWMKPARRSGAGPMMILLALVALAVLAVDQRWIDIERWREILDMI